MPQGISDDEPTLVQVMAWCRQAASHYLSQCSPRSLSSYGVTRPQCVKPGIYTSNNNGPMLTVWRCSIRLYKSLLSDVYHPEAVSPVWKSLCVLAYWDLAVSNGNVDLNQYWLRYWPLVWRHQAITGTANDLSSVNPCGIHMRVISH